MTNKSDLGGSDLHDLTIHTPDIPLNNVGCHDENELLYEALFELTSILGELYALELYIDILRIVDRLGNAEKRDREV
jgi:hypothetical protein